MARQVAKSRNGNKRLGRWTAKEERPKMQQTAVARGAAKADMIVTETAVRVEGK